MEFTAFLTEVVASRQPIKKSTSLWTIKEIGMMAGVAYNEDGRQQAGMGVSANDYDCDGWLDIVKANFADDTITLYRNERDGTFVDATFAAHLARI